MGLQYKFIFSEEFLLTANLRYRRQIIWRRPFYGLKGFLALTLLALTTLLTIVGNTWMVVPFPIIAGMLFLTWPIDAYFLRRRFRKSPFYNDEVSLTFSEEGLHAVGKASEVRGKWPIFTKARRFGDGLLLFQGPQVFHWLPDSAATTPDAIAGV